MQPLAKHQIFLPSWPVLTFGHRDSEETRCLKPCTLITYLVIDPISLLGQLNELPVKRRTSAFICTLSSVYFEIKPRFFNITWHELHATRLKMISIKNMKFSRCNYLKRSEMAVAKCIYFNTVYKVGFPTANSPRLYSQVCVRFACKCSNMEDTMDDKK